MRVLLDECLPRRLMTHLSGHDCRTVPEMGWAGRSNGVLLALASPEFDVFITIDANLRFQQNLSGMRMAILLLGARSNKREDLIPLVPAILHCLQTVEPGTIHHVKTSP